MGQGALREGCLSSARDPSEYLWRTVWPLDGAWALVVGTSLVLASSDIGHFLMPEQAEQSFLNVPDLIDHSMPRHRVGWFWYAAGVFLLMVLLSTYAGTQMAEGRNIVESLSGLG